MDDRIKKWYLTENYNLYKFTIDTHKPRVFDDKINLFPGFMHEEKDYDEYDDKTKDCVNIMLQFYKEVLCSNNEDSYNFIIKWLANMIQGNKNDVMLYLKSQEGVGKSTFSDFLMEYVLGYKISGKGTIDSIKTSYNKILMAKLLVSYEELPTFGPKDWEGVSSNLKDRITSKVMTFGEKYEKSFAAENINNYIVNTNVEALKHSQGRRFFSLDISTIHREDHEYFGNINKKCFNNNIGEAFFNYLRSIDVSNFHAQTAMPMTINKIVAISDRLDSVYKFLKHRFIMFDKSIACIKKTDLYDEYVVYCNQNDIKPRDKIRCYKTLEEINIIPNKTKGYWCYTVSLDKLKEIANKYHWLNGIDDEEQCVGNNFSFARGTNYEELMKENHKLLEQLKANKDVNKLNEELMKENHELLEQLKANKDVNKLKEELAKQTEQIMFGFERLIRQNEAAKCEINQLKNKLTIEQLEQLELQKLQQLLDQTEQQPEQTEQQPEQQPDKQPKQQSDKQPKQQSENIDYKLERIKKRKRKHKKVKPDQDEIDDMFDFSNIPPKLKTPIVEDKKHSKLPKQTNKNLMHKTDETLTKTVISENGEVIGFSPLIC